MNLTVRIQVMWIAPFSKNKIENTKKFCKIFLKYSLAMSPNPSWCPCVSNVYLDQQGQYVLDQCNCFV